MFQMAYHLHWSWDMMNEMPMQDLMLFYRMLESQKDMEKDAAKG
jgi:hypothetical protein